MSAKTVKQGSRMRHEEMKNLRRTRKKILAWLKISQTPCTATFTIPQLQKALAEWAGKNHTHQFLFWHCNEMVKDAQLSTKQALAAGVVVCMDDVRFSVTALGLGVGARIIAFAKDGVDGFDILPPSEMATEAVTDTAPADIPIPAPANWSSMIAELGARVPIGQPS